MKKSAAFFSILLALGANIGLGTGTRAQPAEISACQTISQPGSYRLVNNLTASGSCLVIGADFVTIDLAGFTISGNAAGDGISGMANEFHPLQQGIVVRNGSISNFTNDVAMAPCVGCIVEGLRASCGANGREGIIVGIGVLGLGGDRTAIVKGNTVISCPTGIAATGTITGNNVHFVGAAGGDTGIIANQGSTVIGNTVTNFGLGINAFCPSNVTDNTAVGNGTNLVLNGDGCNDTNNVAP